MSVFVRVSPALEKADGKLFFDCPGRETLHDVNVEAGGPPRRSRNSSIDKSTFHPSILCHYPRCLLENGEYEQVVCHSLATDGRIQFLSDCTYHLIGRTVDLP